ncbi:oxygenase MpaB family protein [Arthrobacter sp. TWP1-1]|uniref:oxygenase MpaB family protein n=1 Tax=Arthrobacter sp. TWP1-1 TaxID=2804568 RepID=UPI003CF25D3C
MKRETSNAAMALKTLADMAPEAVLLAGAGRAILLQLANPAVGYGVADHSSFSADPLRRLHGTLSYIYALSNGTPAQRKSVRRQVQRAHLPVKSGGSRDAPAYNASDPQQQLWVAATLYDSARQVYELVFPALSDGDAESVYQSYAVLGTALGMPANLWPASRADFASYWDEQLETLSVDDTVARVAAQLLAAANTPRWIRVLMPLARFLTAGLLPPKVRYMYGFAWTSGKERMLTGLFKLVSVLVKVTPYKIRSAPMRYYLRRIPG